MAASTYTYYPVLDLIGQANVDLNTEDIKVMLLNNLYTVNQEHSLLSDVSTFEISGTGYTAGGALLANRVYNRTNGIAKITADPALWTNVNITCRYAVYYFPNVVNAPLISVTILDNTPADIAIVNTDFNLEMPENIVIQFGMLA